MNADNSRDCKQANHPGCVCILICFHMQWVCSGGGNGRKDKTEAGVCVKGLSSIPGCVLLSLALSSPIKPATPQQYGTINYRHTAISAARRGERRGRDT